ncbi:hypothetical protein GCM10009826_34320 [Humibacillus xanthopallidus]
MTPQSAQMGYGPVGMELSWPLTDGLVTVRPAEAGDAAAFLDYKRRPECQAYVTRTVDTLEQSRALIDDRLSQPDSLLCALVVGGSVVGDIGGIDQSPWAPILTSTTSTSATQSTRITGTRASPVERQRCW